MAGSWQVQTLSRSVPLSIIHSMSNIQAGSQKKPLHPPITIAQLRALQLTLSLSKPFNACLWAMATCVFWGLMRFGKVLVPSRNAFSPSKHLTRGGVWAGFDDDSKCYYQLDLPSAKIATAGEIQHIFLIKQPGLCPMKALKNMVSVVPAKMDNLLFTWRDNKGKLCLMMKSAAINCINAILSK